VYEQTHFVYLNLAEEDANSFIPGWAAYRGILATPDCILSSEERKAHLALTPHLVRLLRAKREIQLEKELALEFVRRQYYATCISRLSCLYTWRDQETERLASKFWGDQGKHFDEKYLVEIQVHAPRALTIVDTRWIDRYVQYSDEPLSKIGRSWMHDYWQGKVFPWNGDATVPNQPLWECLQRVPVIVVHSLHA
jgi:hypothetical protein